MWSKSSLDEEMNTWCCAHAWQRNTTQIFKWILPVDVWVMYRPVLKVCACICLSHNFHDSCFVTYKKADWHVVPLNAWRLKGNVRHNTKHNYVNIWAFHDVWRVQQWDNVQIFIAWINLYLKFDLLFGKICIKYSAWHLQLHAHKHV